MSRLSRNVLLAVLLPVLAGCSTLASPPRKPLDLCAVFAEKREWQKPAARSEARWGVPVPVLMATMFHESSYRADARPPRRYILGFIPGPRRSTAYGYAQAVNGTWKEYVDRQNRWFARRDDFSDAIDFIGWYHYGTTRELGMRSDDMRNLYLAYHEGRAGFARSSYLAKPWLIAYTGKVEQTEALYRQQYTGCTLAR